MDVLKQLAVVCLHAHLAQHAILHAWPTHAPRLQLGALRVQMVSRQDTVSGQLKARIKELEVQVRW